MAQDDTEMTQERDEAMKRVGEMVLRQIKDARTQDSPLDLMNLPVDPALRAAQQSEPETEEDGIRAEALRRLKVRQMLQGRQAQTPGSSPSPRNTPEKRGLRSGAKAPMSK